MVVPISKPQLPLITSGMNYWAGHWHDGLIAGFLRQMKSRKAYTETVIMLHWLMALPMIGLLIFGLQTMGGHNDHVWPTIHASVGFALLALVASGILWRLRYPPSPFPVDMSKAARLSA